MSGTFETLLDKYGQSVTLCRREGEKETIRAFLQPVTERRETWRQTEPSPMGAVRKDRFLCLSGADTSLENMEEGHLEWRGLRLRVAAAQPICIGDTVSHWWAILTVEDPGEGETDGGTG